MNLTSLQDTRNSIIAAVMGVMLVFGVLIAPQPAAAQTTTDMTVVELQALVASLMAQLAALQALQDNTTLGSGPLPPTIDLDGEASLISFDFDSNNTTLFPGDRYEVLGEMELQFGDGDAEISRFDFSLSTNEGGPAPWELFESVSFWIDGNKVQEADIGDDDEFLDQDETMFRITSLGIVAESLEDVEIVVAATMKDVTFSTSTEWVLQVENVRFFDGDGVGTTVDLSKYENEIEFSVQPKSLSVDSFVVKDSTYSPDSSTFAIAQGDDTTG